MNSAVRQTLPVLSLVVVGFLLKQVGLIRPGDSQAIARLIINTTLPAVIFLSIARAEVAPEKMGLLALCGVLVCLGSGILAGLMVRYLNLERQAAGVVILASMIINIGFVLFPVFLTVYGEEGIGRLATFDLGNSLVANSLGFYVATRYGDRPPNGLWRSSQHSPRNAYTRSISSVALHKLISYGTNCCLENRQWISSRSGA
jgi:hypothetical protein